MALSVDDARLLLEALRTSLQRAGYADAADQILRVANEPLHPDELDDGSEAALDRSESDALDDPEARIAHVDDMLTEPTPDQRVSAAIKIVDLMVVEPLSIEQRMPDIASRAGLDVVEIRIGEGEAQMRLPAQADASTAALAAWAEILSDLREMLADAESNDR